MYILFTLVHVFINFSYVHISFESHFLSYLPFPIFLPSDTYFLYRFLLRPRLLPIFLSLLVSLVRFLRLFHPPLHPTNPCAVDINKHLDYTMKAVSTANLDWKLDFTFLSPYFSLSLLFQHVC